MSSILGVSAKRSLGAAGYRLTFYSRFHIRSLKHLSVELLIAHVRCSFGRQTGMNSVFVPCNFVISGLLHASFLRTFRFPR